MSKQIDIPLSDEIDFQQDKSDRIQLILKITVPVVIVLLGVAWWWTGNKNDGQMAGKLPHDSRVIANRKQGKWKQPPVLKKKLSILERLKEGNRLYKKGKFNKVISLLNAGMKEKKHQEVVVNNLGVALFSKGRFVESAAMFKKAIDTAPYFPDAHLNLAYVSEKMGNKNKSLHHYKRFLELAEDRHASLISKVKERIGKF
ncbi:MAG: tetratricopeptide repeat protein [bacterium]